MMAIFYLKNLIVICTYTFSHVTFLHEHFYMNLHVTFSHEHFYMNFYMKFEITILRSFSTRYIYTYIYIFLFRKRERDLKIVISTFI